MSPTDPAQSLCLSCGLCCDGSLFWGVSLEEGEVSPSPTDEAGVLRQPCACFDGACTIYSARPTECRAFTCHVLDAVTEGSRDRDWALAQIAGMRRILAALDDVLPGILDSLFAIFPSADRGFIVMEGETDRPELVSEATRLALTETYGSVPACV